MCICMHKGPHIHVSIYVCIIHMPSYVLICTHMCIYACIIYVFMYTLIYIHTHNYACVAYSPVCTPTSTSCAHPIFIRAHSHICAHIYTRIPMHVPAYMPHHVSLYPFMYTSCIRVHTCSHTRILVGI